MRESDMRRTGLTLLLIICLAGLSAQDGNFYKDMLRESLDLNLVFEAMEPKLYPDTASWYLNVDAARKPLPRLTYNFEQNSLFLNYKEPIPETPPVTISPHAVSLKATNREVFDRNSTETTVDLIANGILTPIAALGTFNILVVADYLMRIGVLPDEPFVSKEKRTAKKLREIKSLYDLD